MAQAKTKNVIISWNGVPIATGKINHAINKTINKVENSVNYGIRFGAQKTIDDGKRLAREILRLNDAMGPRKRLWSSIRSEQRGKNNYWLIAGQGMGERERYPLYIEKGFKPHFVPMNPFLMQWLDKASPAVKEYAIKRGGLVVGKDPKWRTGIGYMDGAFSLMRSNIPLNVRDEIIKNLKKSMKR